MYSNDEIKLIRSEKINARNALSLAKREKYSADICHNILGLSEYKKSRTIMIYKWIKGEVRLDELEMKAPLDGKILLYPLTLGEGKMVSVQPGSTQDAWKKGSFGISEPLAERGKIIAPEEIDLIVCPCTAFDVKLNRLGMGGGYYDRFLPKCVRAFVITAAFEIQKYGSLPVEPHDIPMQAVVTEKYIYLG